MKKKKDANKEVVTHRRGLIYTIKKFTDKLHIQFEEPDEIDERLRKVAEFRLHYYLLIIVSSVIATFGLIQNSSAVIIGAMVVAPFMVPLLVFSYATVWCDGELLGKSLLSIFRGTGVAFLVSFFITLIIIYLYHCPFYPNEIPSEILMRTRPSPFDFFIAFFAGIAGAYAYVDNNIRGFGEVLVGIAISVALMPPLCTSGVGLGISFITGSHEIFFRAGQLFLVNLLCILLAGVFVFCIYYIFKYLQRRENRVKDKIYKSIASTLSIIFVLSFFCVLLYVNINKNFSICNVEKKMKEDIRSIIDNELVYLQIDDYKVSFANNKKSGLITKIKIYDDEITDKFKPGELKGKIHDQYPEIATSKITIEFVHKMKINNDIDIGKVKKYLSFYEKLR